MHAGEPPELLSMVEEFSISIPMISISIGACCAARSGERGEPARGLFIQSTAKLQAQNPAPRTPYLVPEESFSIYLIQIDPDFDFDFDWSLLRCAQNWYGGGVFGKGSEPASGLFIQSPAKLQAQNPAPRTPYLVPFASANSSLFSVLCLLIPGPAGQISHPNRNRNRNRDRILMAVFPYRLPAGGEITPPFSPGR
jgi:hypothetical protein